jgi:hypothetical protein
MIKCDTKIVISPLTKGFVWLNQINFPFPAYYQITQDLRRRPTIEQARQCWDVMSENWEAWFNIHFSNNSPIFQLLTKVVLQAWEAYGAASNPSGQNLTTLRIVSSIKVALVRVAEIEQSPDMERANTITDMGTNAFPMSMQMPATFLDHSLLYSMGIQTGYSWTRPEISSASDSAGQGPQDTSMNQIDWTAYGGPPVWQAAS